MRLQNDLVKCMCVMFFFTGIKGSLLDLFGNRLLNESKQDERISHGKTRTVAMDLINKYNYPAESHEVETEDGYLITVHRIARPGKPVALLQHGMSVSSDVWLVRGPDQDLAFLLANEGYDVWMNNVRGNTYSRKHRTLNPDTDKKFWDFSFHELGYYDLPAVIDYILNVTEEKSVVYIGHSMGTTAFFVLCSTRPEYNNKISIAHNLSPAVLFLTNFNPVQNLIFSLASVVLEPLCNEEQMYELVPYKESVSKLAQALCDDASPLQQYCVTGLFIMAGVDYEQMNTTLLSMYLKYLPAGTTLNTYLHYLGNILSRSFRRMDYGEEENSVRYGEKLPPEYNLKKVTAPVVLYYGDRDILIDKKNTEALAARLPNLINVIRVPFNHVDFISAKDTIFSTCCKFPETMMLENIVKYMYAVLFYTSIRRSLLDLVGNRLLNEEERISHVKTWNAAVDLIEKYNYPAESHEVETEDGYLITVHRIARPGKPVALLQHGISVSSDYWLVRGPGQDLAFILADEGYDVWLSNIRGNVYSRKHRYLNPDTDKKFWDFSFHELGYYDLPAVIDYILNVTEEKSVVYIGHSMGTTAFFVLCSTRPEYNNKISIAHNLSPAVLLIHNFNPIPDILISAIPTLAKICKEEQIYELLPLRESFSKFLQAACIDSNPFQQFCIAGFFMVFGEDYKQMNGTLLSIYVKYSPAGMSLNTLLHYYGNIRSGSFRRMDYGKKENLARYGEKFPPEYNLKKVTAPVALYYGDGDFLVDKNDTEALAARLPNLINVIRVPFPNFNHIDFIMAKDARELLYEPMLTLTQKYIFPFV